MQVACPPGGEDRARIFYGEGLGLVEVEKPELLKGRGGAWFRGYAEEVVTAEIHVGVESPFRPALKAHPAFLLGGGTGELEATATRLVALGFEVDWSQRHTFPGAQRFHTADAAGNRVELLAGP